MDRKEIFIWVSEARLGHRQYLVDEIHRPIDRVSGPVQSLYYCLCFYAGHHLVKQAGDYPHCFFLSVQCTDKSIIHSGGGQLG